MSRRQSIADRARQTGDESLAVTEDADSNGNSSTTESEPGNGNDHRFKSSRPVAAKAAADGQGVLEVDDESIDDGSGVIPTGGRRRAKARAKAEGEAPASRPSRRRDVAEEETPEEDRFPWHYKFDDDEPEELHASTPLLSRAFRATMG